jgi:hypothetical protein
MATGALVGGEAGLRGMGRAALVMLGVVVAAAACSSGMSATPPVPLPPDAATVATLEEKDGTWSVLERSNGCLLVQAAVGDRRWVSDERCRDAFLGTALDVAERGVRFNDVKREYQECSGDCAGPPSDVEMSSPVLWGAVSEQTGFVCFVADEGPVVAWPNDAGFVLAPTPGAENLHFPDDILTFLPDGRYIGTDPPERPEAVGRCQAAGAPGATRPTAQEWPFTIEVPESMRTSEFGLFIATDTGWAPEGASLQLLAQGHQIPLRLHPDTTVLTVSREVEPTGLKSQTLGLPATVIDILNGTLECVSPPQLILRLDDDGTAALTTQGGC